MFLMGLGALLVLGGILYTARTAIWRGPLSGPYSSRPVRDTLEPPRRGMGFLGVRNELARHSPHGSRCNSVGVGGQFLASAIRAYVKRVGRPDADNVTDGAGA